MTTTSIEQEAFADLQRRVYFAAIEGLARPAIALAANCTEREAQAALGRLVIRKALVSLGKTTGRYRPGRVVPRFGPPSPANQLVTVIDIFRARLSALVDEAKDVKNEIELTRAHERLTLRTLYAAGRALASEARVVERIIAGFERGEMTRELAERLLADDRRRQLTEHEHEDVLAAIDHQQTKERARSAGGMAQ